MPRSSSMIRTFIHAILTRGFVIRNHASSALLKSMGGILALGGSRQKVEPKRGREKSAARRGGRMTKRMTARACRHHRNKGMERRAKPGNHHQASVAAHHD